MTSVDNNTRTVVLGASSGPAPHARLSTSFTLRGGTSSSSVLLEGDTGTITGTASASIVSPQTGDVVSNVEFVSGSLSSTLRTVSPGAAGATSTIFSFPVLSTDLAQTITFTGMYRVTATINGDTSTTTHSFNANFVLAPSWATAIGTTAPTDFLAATNQGIFAIGDVATVTVPDGVRQNIYIWVPTTSLATAFFTNATATAFWQADRTLGITDGDHSLLSIGSAAPGGYSVRVGGT